MAFRARLDGVNDYISFGGELPLAVDGYIESAFVVQDIIETFIRLLSDNLTSTGNSRLIVETNGDRVLFRVNASTDVAWAGVFGSALTVGQRIVLRVAHSGTNTLELFIDSVSKGVAVAPVNNQGVGNFEFCGVNGGVYSQIDVEYVSLVNNATPANSRYYDANASGGAGVDVPETTGNGVNATLVNGGTWVEYSDTPTVTPIAFTGTIPTQSFTNGQIVNVDLSGYFTGSETPFTFANTGTALAGSGLSLSSAGLLSGTATESSITGVIVTGTDTDTNTASSNPFNVAVAAAAQVPQGTVTIGAITVTETTASVPFSYNASDETGYVYRLNGGAPVALAASPISLTGLTENTAYTIDVAATNATGAGAYSAVASFTTDAVVVASFTSEPLYNNTNQLTGLLANAALDYVALYDNITGALVLRVTGISTDATGVFTVSNSALTAGVTYKADWQLSSTGIARMPAKAAV